MAHKGKWKKTEAEKIVRRVETNLTGTVYDIMVCGSYRRGKSCVGDLDFVVVPVEFEKMKSKILEMADQVVAGGEKSIRIIVPEGIQIDFMITDEECFHSAVLHSTGSKWFNIKCRKIAQEMGMRLSQYGLLRNETGERAATTELGILEILGMDRFFNPRSRS